MENERKFAVVEKRFEYKKHECICIFSCRGFRCGYVSVDEDIDYMERTEECHGGLTFSGRLLYDYGQTKEYYIGFDCGHCYDGLDFDLAFEYGLITEEEAEGRKEDWRYCESYPVCDLQYVENQCKRLVDQIED